MGCLYSKEGVQFSVIKPAGFRILSALDQTAQRLNCDLIITSACDGQHSGPSDPHHSGEAYDVRSHDMSHEQKDVFLAQVMHVLGWDSFYGFLESPGDVGEHFHFQKKRGTTYP